MSQPRIGVTLGDPRGIGPEVVAKALADPQVRDAADFVVFGPDHLMDWPDFVAVGAWTPADGPSSAGRVAGAAIAEATQAAMDGRIDALVTAPIDKGALHVGGWHYPGHTEMLQDLTRAPVVGMLMSAERTAAGGPLRVLLATTHVALRAVPDLVTQDLLVDQARLASFSLRESWGLVVPRLALCALNPHASDGGLFGDEEERILTPAVEQLLSEGIAITGPVPADTVFTRAIRGEFDAVVCPYHDVGMAAFKTVSFGSGVNVTLGLPFPRTSPDHGTAIDIAGQGIADSSSMIEAILLAVRLARDFDASSLRR